MSTQMTHAHQPALPEIPDALRIILSVLLPPVGVFFRVEFGFRFWLNLLLTVLGYVPGLIHAMWVTTRG